MHGVVHASEKLRPIAPNPLATERASRKATAPIRRGNPDDVMRVVADERDSARAPSLIVYPSGDAGRDSAWRTGGPGISSIDAEPVLGLITTDQR